MQDDDHISMFDRMVGAIAWNFFWTIIGGICMWLKLFNRGQINDLNSSATPRNKFARLGFCENGLGFGGAAISLAAFLEKLPPEFEAVIYTGIGTEEYSKFNTLGLWRHIPAIRLISVDKLISLRVPFSSSFDNLFNLLPSAFRYYFAFKRDKIQCVYLNNDASCNFAAAIAAYFARLPLILHARGFNCDTKGNRWVLSKLDHCIPVSNAVMSELLSLGMTAEKCTVVPEGLDLTKFYPRQGLNSLRQELGLVADEPVVTLIGGLVDWKGQDVLIDAAPIILKKFPNLVILIVGKAYGKDDRFANSLLERAAAPNLLSRVRMLGSRDDVADILACSDIVIHASTKPEPFGRTFLEGMALGKPVIASNEGGPLDVISHGVDGLLIEPRCPEKLAEAIVALLDDRTLATTLGTNAAAKATFYSIEKHAELICAVLRREVLCSEIGYAT